MQAYIATIKAEKGFLLGGVRIHNSAPMPTYADAIHWAEAAMDINRTAGRWPLFAGTETVDVPEERICRLSFADEVDPPRPADTWLGADGKLWSDQ